MKAQEEARGLIREAVTGSDKTFEEGLVASSEYAEGLTADMAVVFHSLFAGDGEDLSLRDVHMAVDFQDYLDSLGYEIRRRT